MEIKIDSTLQALPVFDHSSGYTPENYPHLVACSDSNWQIYANDAGRLASIAVKPTCKSTMFGDVHHIRHIMSHYGRNYTLTPYGASLIGERFLDYLRTL
jgi:hypothetical protein